MTSRAPIFLLALSLFASGCSLKTSPTSPPALTATSGPHLAFPRDNLNRNVALQAPAQRAIILGPGAIETAFFLGANSQLVGRDATSDFPLEARKLPVAGDYRGPNLEATLALRPDLVVIQGEGQSKSQLDEWQSKLGVPVAALGATTLAGVTDEARKLSAWLGQNQNQKVAEMQKRLAASPIVAKNRPRVFIEIGRSPLWSAGRNTLVGAVVEAAGFQNSAPIRGYQAYSLEALSAQKVDYYLVPTKKTRAETLAELRKLPALRNLAPIRAGKILLVNPDLVFRPGPRLGDGIKQLRAAHSPS